MERLRRLSVMDAMGNMVGNSGHLTMLDGVPQSFIERNDQNTVAVPDHDLGYDFWPVRLLRTWLTIHSMPARF